MKSVVQELKTEDFYRIRIGIGNLQYKEDLINFVLTKIPKEEYEILERAQEKAVLALKEIIKNNIDSAMNKYN